MKKPVLVSDAPSAIDRANDDIGEATRLRLFRLRQNQCHDSLLDRAAEVGDVAHQPGQVARHVGKRELRGEARQEPWRQARLFQLVEIAGYGSDLRRQARAEFRRSEQPS